ncbi:replication initiator [Pedococcus sp. NPDC057267]|uniref:replication initiator n=1 Tax=Pedococcus sp. NPDC057267 TaxID=3346077 RepID=UPI003636AC3A
MHAPVAGPVVSFWGHGDAVGLDLDGLSDTEERQVLRRLTSRRFDDWAAAASRVGHCTGPIRVRGTSTTFDVATGQPIRSYSTDSEPLGVLHLRCGNRRADVCPSCSRLYAADMFHLLRSGVVGGKGVPAHVLDNPLVFTTLTAPSFGAVHSAASATGRCHPRSKAPRCPHGRSTGCFKRHSDVDPELGQPLCWECYDYRSQVVWQWWAPELWRRFTIALRRAVARHLGVAPRDLNEVATVQYAKVAEFQLRGVVHFHALIRCDGPRTDDGFSEAPASVSDSLLANLVVAAAAAVRFTAPPVLDETQERQLQFGRQVDARAVTAARRLDDPSSSLKPEQVAGYLAKYSTKSATASADGGSNAHLKRIKAVAGAVADAIEHDGNQDESAPYELMSHWVHMLGFRGHFATKSRRYSVTLGALRRARQRAQRLLAHAQEAGQPLDLSAMDALLMADEEDETTLVIGDWRFAGRGWETPGDAALARAAAARAREYDQWRAEQRRNRPKQRS